MISFTRPTPEQLRRLAGDLTSRPLSYAEGLLKRVTECTALPTSTAVDTKRSFAGIRADGWFVDRFAEVVGHGPNDFESAKTALRGWRMFDQPWTAPLTPDVSLEVGQDVTYGARVLGVWWCYGCRILRVDDETKRFGFVYGTIAGHAERGEELFQVELLDNGDVEFSLFAMSRPGRWFAWPGLPIARLAQQRFRQGAAAGIRRFVEDRRHIEAVV